MKTATLLVLALSLFTTAVFAQNLDLLTPELLACTSPNANIEGSLKRVNVLIADIDAKAVSMSVRSKRTAVYSRTNTILSVTSTLKESVYILNRNTKDVDYNRATLTVDNEKKTAVYERNGPTLSPDRYKNCRAFAKGDYSAINIWIKNQL